MDKVLPDPKALVRDASNRKSDAGGSDTGSVVGAVLGKDLEDQERKARLDDEKELTRLRKRYGKWVLWIITVWLGCALVLLAFQGFHLCGFCLSDSAIYAFLALTGAQVLGLPFIVLRGLFAGGNRK